MSDVRFPVMLTRNNDRGSFSTTAHDLYELQKTMVNELKVSFGYASMCDASEIVTTFKRRGYFVRSVKFSNFEEDDA
jgi:hypothetical protein